MYLLNTKWRDYSYLSNDVVSPGLATINGTGYAQTLSLSLCYFGYIVIPFDGVSYTTLTATLGYADDSTSLGPQDIAISYQSSRLTTQTANNDDPGWVVLAKPTVERTAKPLTVALPAGATALLIMVPDGAKLCGKDVAFGDAKLS